MHLLLALAAALLRKQSQAAPDAANATTKGVAKFAVPRSAPSQPPPLSGCCEANVQCPGTLSCAERSYVCMEKARSMGEPLGTNRVYWRNPILEDKLAEACEETKQPEACKHEMNAKELPFFTYPRVWYQKVREIAASTFKKHRYCFMGSGTPCRWWVPEFASSFFDKSDFLGFTDKSQGYQALGDYNFTSGFQGHRPQDYRSNGKMTEDEKEEIRDKKNTFDEAYFRGLAECEYALAPRGMEPYSMRFYEALAAGSIPVLRSSRDQRRSPDEEVLVLNQEYKYVQLPVQDGKTMKAATLLSKEEYAAAVEANRLMFETKHLISPERFFATPT